MNKQTIDTEILQWHPALFAGIQLEFQEESASLTFESEHQLGTKPKAIDILIVKKDASKPIQKNIGHIFRKHNIIEYKGPEDYLSIDDFYMVYGYTCFYKADTPHTDIIKANEITITFISKYFPRSLVNHLINEHHWTLQKQEDGIYYIDRHIFPIQIIVTSRLSKEHNFWLCNLTNDIKDTKTASEIVHEYSKYPDNKLCRSVMDIIVRANKESFKEVNNMCDALKELFQEELDMYIKEQAEIRAAKRAEELAKERAEELARERAEELAKERAEELAKELADVKLKGITDDHSQKTRLYIQNICKHLQIPAEKAMELLGLSFEERKLYA